MRIIFWLAAAGAVAIGTAAEARPGGMSAGHGGNSNVGWSNGGGSHARTGGRTHFGPGAGQGDRRHHGRLGRFGRDDFQPFGGAGIAGPFGAVDPYGNGFFNGGGGRARLRGGRPYYDYDRAYPYQWPSAAGGHQDWDEEEHASERPPRCTIENGVRVCRGW